MIKISNYPAFFATVLASLLLTSIALIQPSMAVFFVVGVSMLSILSIMRGFSCIVDYRFWYLLGLNFWVTQHSLSHVTFDVPIDREVGVVYVCLVCFGAVLPLVFRSDHQYIWRKLQVVYISSFEVSMTILIFLVYLVLAVVTSVIRVDDFILHYATKAFQVLSAATLGATLGAFPRLKSSKYPLTLCLIIMLCLVAFGGGAESVGNRTTVLMPLTVFLAAFTVRLFPVLQKRKHELYSVLLALGLLMVVSLLIGDLQKKNGVPIWFIAGKIIDGNAGSLVFTEGGLSYFATDGRGGNELLYFASIETALSVGKNYFYNLLQNVTIFVPRFFFQGKADFDVSRLAFNDGYVEAPMYFELFLEQILDGGIIMVLFYYTLFMVMGWLVQRRLRSLINRSGGVFLGISQFVILCVITAYALRGPVILWGWFVIPTLLGIFLLSLFTKNHINENEENHA